MDSRWSVRKCGHSVFSLGSVGICIRTMGSFWDAANLGDILPWEHIHNGIINTNWNAYNHLFTWIHFVSARANAIVCVGKHMGAPGLSNGLIELLNCLHHSYVGRVRRFSGESLKTLFVLKLFPTLMTETYYI